MIISKKNGIGCGIYLTNVPESSWLLEVASPVTKALEEATSSEFWSVPGCKSRASTISAAAMQV